MNIKSLHSDALAALSVEPDADTLTGLANDAKQLADMVGWADGAIDRDGSVSGAFIRLQAQVRARYEETEDASLAIFHDAIGDLIAAIFRHDSDLKPAADDDNVEM